MKKKLLLLSLLVAGLGASAQLTVNNAVNAVDGVQNILLGEGVTVTNITFAGDNAQIGSFTCAGGCNLNIGNGIVMGSGNIDQTPGNGSTSSSLTPASGFGASDPDLAELSGFTLNDAAVLQFDFESTGSTVAFNFVFGSDEYPEFVNAGFNDAFGFFLSGPGISGPYLNNAANIALVPNTTTPVTIDNVNGGLNWQYYVDNNGSVGNNNVIECDGFTTVLTAFAEVQCGETYHIKLAIADAGDTSYDSFVFLEAGSFESSELFSTFVSPNLAPPGGGIYEGCQTGYVSFVAPESTVEQTFNLDFSGTALNGIDVEMIASQIVIPANESEVLIPVTAIPDGVLEGNESLIITVEGATTCGEDVMVEVILSDLPALQVSMPDVTINCGDQAVLTPAISGGLGNYVVEWETGLVNQTLSVYPSDPMSYEFTVTDTCGVEPYEGIANILFVDNPPLAVNIGDDLELTCLDPAEMAAAVSGGLGPYEYYWSANGIFVSSTDEMTLMENEEQEIILTVTDACDEVSDDLAMIYYPPVPVLVDLGSDLTVTCLDISTLDPNPSGGVGTYTYEWSTQQETLGYAADLDYQADETIVIAVEVTDQCGNTSTDEITIAVPQVNISLEIGQDYSTTCIEETLISPDISGGVGNYSYSWTLDGTVISVSATAEVQADEDAELILTVEDQCGNTTSDELQVAVPPVPVSADAGSDLVVTCLDISELTVAATGGVGNYSYQWTDSDGDVGAWSSLNYQAADDEVITVTVTDECGNTTTDNLTIAVPAVPVYVTVSNDTTVCYGESVTMNALATGGVGELSYEWENNEGQTSTIHHVYPVNSQMVIVEVRDQCGNVVTDGVWVNVVDVHPAFSANYLNDNTIEFTNLTHDAESIEWQFSDGTTSTEENPIHEFVNIDQWSVTLSAVGPLGCVKSVSQDYAPLGNLFIPNCFTPNNDGINDFLFVLGHDLETFEWWIYNRWGDLIYHSTDISQPWDGSYKKNEHFVPDGVYTYRVIGVGKRDNVIDYTGSVLLTR